MIRLLLADDQALVRGAMAALLDDPVAAVAGVHAAFGLDFDEADRAATAAELDASRSGTRAPRHAYDLADYGLTADEVRSRLQP